MKSRTMQFVGDALLFIAAIGLFVLGMLAC